MQNLNRLVRVARPILFLLAALTFSLGAAISHYLGKTVDLLEFFLGLLAVFAIQVSAAWLSEYFRLSLAPLLEGETVRLREQFRVTLLQSAYAALTLTGLIVISLVVASRLNIPSVALLVVIILFFMAYAIPPLHLADKGYGEILLAIYLGTWLPSFSFLLEYGQFHRLLTFTTFPLTLMAVAYFLVIDFPTYVSDQKLGRFSLLSRLSWQRAIPIHHLLLLAAFVLFTAGPFFGIPWALVWPALLVLPFAVVQIIWLQRISLGGPTFWNFLTTLALATFGLTAYLLAFTFWTR